MIAAQATRGSARRRPDVDAVATLALRLLRSDTAVTIPMLVGAIRRETTCSRATAYRAVTDAVKAGALTTGARTSPPPAKP